MQLKDKHSEVYCNSNKGSFQESSNVGRSIFDWTKNLLCLLEINKVPLSDNHSKFSFKYTDPSSPVQC